MPKKERAGLEYRDSFNRLQAEGVTNIDLLKDLNRKSSVNPVKDDLDPGISGINDLLANLDRTSPTGATVTQADTTTQRSPITQQGYSGQTFSMPTFAAEGLTFPFHILSKRAQERRDNEAEAEKEKLAFDYDIAEISDNVRNAIFIDKQKQHYDDLLEKLSNDPEIGGRQQALKYMKDNNIIKLAGAKWRNLQGLYDKTFQSYVKVMSDTDALGRAKYDPKTRAMAEAFGKFINNIDNFDPDKIDQYAKFYNKFNESVPVSDMAKLAAAEMQRLSTLSGAELAEGIETAERVYVGQDAPESQRKLFREAMEYYVKNPIGQHGAEKEIDNEYNIYIKNLEDRQAKERQALAAENSKEIAQMNIDSRERIAAEQAASKEVATKAKKGQITISDQSISVTDPTTGTKVNINGKNVITFPDKKFSVVPGRDVYVEGEGWLTINDAVEFKPLREFETSINQEDRGKNNQQAISILEENSDKNFVKRILEPGKYPSIKTKEGEPASHMMAYGETDGRYLVYPTIVQKREGGELEQLDDNKAMRYALRNNEYIEFDNEKDAKWFSSDNGYKSVWDSGGFFTDEGTKKAYVQAEINASGTVKDEEGYTRQDVIQAADRNGKQVALRGKRTILVPQENVKDKLKNEFGEDYEAAKSKKITMSQLSVAKYNEKWGTSYTKKDLEKNFGDKAVIVD